MIHKTLKTITGKLQVSIPTELNEITLGQMMAMQDAPQLSDIDAISILSGVAATDLKQVQNAGELLTFGEQIMNLSQQITHLYNSDAIPQKINFVVDGKAKEVEVIKNLSVEPAGAFMAARDVITDEITAHIKKYGEENWEQNFNPSLAACASVLAYYFYCRVTGKPFDEQAIEAFTEVVKKLRVTEALPISKHFFTNYPSLSTRKTDFWHRALQLLSNVLGFILFKNSNTLTR